MVPADDTITTSTATRSATSAANVLSFAGCCRMLDAVEKTPKRDAKLRLVFSNTLRQELGDSGDMYPLLRLLLPQLDRGRTYNLKEKKIAKVYIDVLGMSSESRDAQKLENFNDPTVVQSKAVGDFAAVLYDILIYRSLVGNKKHQHTVGFVNELLDQLVKAEDNAARKKVFMRLATEFPANEQKWIVRILLKDLKIGLHHERVLNFIHPDAMEMYNHTSDLHKVCVDLRNSSIRYVPKIEPFQVFSPMLAKRVDFGECTTAIKSDVFVMEPKLDGERITCHVKNRKVQFISRNGINYTENYESGITPYVLSQVIPGVDVIFDGEMMVWDNLEYRMREFGILKNVANAMRAGENTNKWLCYVVWDVVYLGGEKAEQLIREVYRGPGGVSAVMGLPQYARRQLLLKVLKPLDHRIVIIEQTIVNSKSTKERHEMVMAEVDKQVSNGGEGVILKDIDSHYMCGESSRKAKKWIKLKPDYAGMTTNLDVIIVGGFYGTGRRRSGDVSVFLLGVLSRAFDEAAAEEAMKPGAPCPVVYTFAKAGTGYSRDELVELRRELEPHWQPWDNDNIPTHLNGWKPQKSDLKPDVWIDPRHSKILEVYGFELTSTTLYQTGLTIRFPRCKAIRNDKQWYQCLNLQDLNTARRSLFNKRAADVALGQKKAIKRAAKRFSTTLRPIGGIVADFSQAKLEGVELKRNVFEGKEFCVLPGKYEKPKQFEMPKEIMGENERQVSKQVVEKLLHSYGSTIVQNPIAGTTDYVVAASDAGFKVANLVKQGRFNIVYLHWVTGCISSSRLLLLKARDFVFANESMRALLAKEYDQFGDHFTEHVKPDDLRLVFKEVMRLKSVAAATHDGGDAELAEPWQTGMKALAAEEEEAMECEFTFLSHCVVYFDQFTMVHAAKEYVPYDQRAEFGGEHVEVDPFGEMKLLVQQVRLFGGTVVNEIDASVTHIVVHSRSDRGQIDKLQPVIRVMRRLNAKEPPTVQKEWVQHCIKQRMQLPVDEFFIPV